MIPPRPPELGPLGSCGPERGGHWPVDLQLARWAAPSGQHLLGMGSLNSGDDCPCTRPTPPPLAHSAPPSPQPPQKGAIWRLNSRSGRHGGR